MSYNNQIIIYQTADNKTQIDVRLENETVWLTTHILVDTMPCFLCRGRRWSAECC